MYVSVFRDDAQVSFSPNGEILHMVLDTDSEQPVTPIHPYPPSLSLCVSLGVCLPAYLSPHMPMRSRLHPCVPPSAPKVHADAPMCCHLPCYVMRMYNYILCYAMPYHVYTICFTLMDKTHMPRHSCLLH